MSARMALSSLRPFASSSRQTMRSVARTMGARCLATGAEPSAAVSPASAPAAPPAADAKAGSSAPVDPKLSAIVDQIEVLSLLQASQLVAALKERLNIQDIAMPSAAAAPVAAAPAAEAAEEDKPKEKTMFSLKLKGLKDATAKAKVIKEVKAINSSMNLVEAKKFVESAPQTLKEGLNKEDVEKLKTALEAAGAEVVIE